MKLNEDRCTGCGYCVLVCPQAAVVTDGWARILNDRCTDCNQCLHACPNDCFEAEVTPQSQRPPVREGYEVVVIGAGIGGLMTAAAMARSGRSVAVFEQLLFPGGRYTALDYKGVPVTTAAWTSLGPRCRIGRFLNDLGIESNDLEYVSLQDVGLSEQFCLRFSDGRHYGSLMEMLDPGSRRAWLRAVARGRKQPLAYVSAHDFILGFSDNPDLLAAVDAIALTSSGVSSQNMPASEFIQITLDAREAGVDFAMPRAGVRTLIQALCQSLGAAGGDLFLKTAVTRVTVEHGRASGIELEGNRHVSAELVLHNAGPSRLVQLVGPDKFPAAYLAHLRSLKPAHCAAVFFATEQCLFDDAPMLMTPGCERVAGVFSPTILDPGMSQNGLHLYDAFFPLYGQDRRSELAVAMQDLRALFPNLDRMMQWSVPMFFTGAWPGTESCQTFGQIGEERLDPATPIPGLCLVGMDVKGSGTAGDLVPVGVRRLLQTLGCPLPVDC